MNLIDRVSWRVVRRKLRTSFTTALGSKNVAASVLVEVTLSDGQKGLGEAPTSFVQPHETLDAIQEIFRQGRDFFRHKPISDYESLLAKFAAAHAGFHMTLAALEVALFRAHLHDKARGEFEHWGGRQKSIQTDITIPFLPESRLLKSWLAKVSKTGFEHYKIKVSGQVERDMPFVKQVRDTLVESGQAFTLRLDGNQGYSTRSYQRMLRELEKARIVAECFEQPLRRDDWAGLRKLPKDTAVPLILDETVFSAEQCRRALDERVCQGVNIKIAKSGIAESARIHRAARQAGAKLMIGCMTETMVGLSAGIHLAAGRGGFDFIDLDSVHLMAPGKAFGGIAVAGCRYHVQEEQ